MKQEKKPYLWLFTIHLFISAFTFGGGYVVVPMIRRYFVDRRHYITEEELSKMAAVAQSTPGAIAVNLSALSGYHVAGAPGAVISCIAAVTPPLIILAMVSAFYTFFLSNAVVAAVLKGMQAGAAALITDLIIDMFRMILKERSPFLTALVPCAFLANFILDINVAVILIVSSVICVARVFWRKRTASESRKK